MLAFLSPSSSSSLHCGLCTAQNVDEGCVPWVTLNRDMIGHYCPLLSLVHYQICPANLNEIAAREPLAANGPAIDFGHSEKKNKREATTTTSSKSSRFAQPECELSLRPLCILMFSCMPRPQPVAYGAPRIQNDWVPNGWILKEWILKDYILND